MTTVGVDQRIFLVGVPRSGTTLVQSLLAAHSQIASFTESHFFSRHFAILPLSTAAILVRDPVPRLQEFLIENSIEGDAFSDAQKASLSSVLPRHSPLPLRTRAVARRLLRVLDELAALSHKPIWVEKTPRHLRYLPFLERLSQSERETRFVHVIRRGQDVVASLHQASQEWERPYDLATCVRRWNRDMSFSLSRAASDSDRFIFYEELTEQTEGTLRRLCAQLDLRWEPEMIERQTERAGALIARQETWKANVFGPIRPSTAASGSLSEEQRRFVTESLKSDLYARLREATE